MALCTADGTAITKTKFPSEKVEELHRVTETVYEESGRDPRGRVFPVEGKDMRTIRYAAGEILPLTAIHEHFPAAAASSISPDRGSQAGGTAVVIRGAHLDGVTGVTFDGVDATDVRVIDPSEVHCVTPATSVGSKDVVIKDDSGPISKAAFYTYA